MAASSSPSPIKSPSITPVNGGHPLPPKLTNNNYPSWRAQLLAILNGHGLTGHIDGRTLPPKHDPDSPSDEYNHWFQQDQLILAAILCSLTEPLVPLISSASTAAEAWTTLSTMFASKSRSRVMQLKDDLARATIGDRTVDEFLQSLKVKADELSIIDKPLSDDDLTLYILKGLGPRFREIAASIRARETSISFAELRDMLVAQELYLKTLETQETTLLASANFVSLTDPTAQAASTALNKKLEQLSRENLECTIYRVHRALRSVNPKAYEPEVIAIGPYHRGKDRLKMMEDHKLRNLQSLIKAKRCDIGKCVAAVARLEPEARKCYADQRISPNSGEFIEMLVLDGCFIVELVQKFNKDFQNEKSDSIFKMRWIIISLQRDLMLFENQVPFFVLSKLFELVKDPGEHSTLLPLLSNFFRSLYPGRGQIKEPKEDPNRPIKHLLDLIHRSWLPPSGGRKEEKELKFVRSVTSLKEANVKFEKNEAAQTLFDIDFKDGVMLMAPLSIYDTTECVLRNLIAYEQYFEHSPHNFVTDYVTFLDGLINSPKDVELLSGNEILENGQGDDKVVAKMVNRLCDSVVYSTESFFYGGVSEGLKKHCRKPWNKWKAKLRRNYLNSPWAIISIVVAAVLLLLTVTQTVFSILQVVS